jgi:hypothetical protein
LTSSQRTRLTPRLLFGRLAVVLCLTAGITAAVTAGVAGLAQAQANSGGQSRCGTVTVAKSVVQLGQTVTASATRGSGWTKSCGDTWSWGAALPVGKTVGGCTEGASVCMIKTTQLTGSLGGSFSFLGFCIEGDGGLEWSSCGVYAVVPKGALIEGNTNSPQGVAIPGVQVQASGPGGVVSGLSGTNGEYLLVVKPGTYRVAPVHVLATNGTISTTRATFDPASVSRTATVDRPVIANFTVIQQDTLTVQVNPAQVDASGVATVQVTITDTSPGAYGGSGPSPVVGARIVVEPPVEVGNNGVASGLLCNSTNKLVSPVRLHDGSLLGTHFWATTDSNGEVVLTLYVGTVSGRWVIDAYQPGPGGAPLVSASVDVAPVPGRLVIDKEGDLLGHLIATGDTTLLQTGQSLQRNVLEWLGEADAQLQSVTLGVGYAPIYGVDATGATNAGVVIFAPSPTVRGRVLDYLDGTTTAAPSEDEAWVIDIGDLSKMLATGKFTGNEITHVQYRLPSLQVWAEGEKVLVARAEDKAIQSDVPTLVPVAGRVAPGHHPVFGLVGAKGNESMLYGYGPYLPAPGSSPAAVALEGCVTA